MLQPLFGWKCIDCRRYKVGWGMLGWYLLYCKGRTEHSARQRFTDLGLDTFLAELEVDSVVRNRRNIRKVPLFPNYLFVRFDPHTTSISRLLSVPGVRNIVKIGGVIAPVETALVVALRKQLQKSPDIELEAPSPGDKATILSGPFANLDAVFVEPDGDTRCKLLLDFIGKPTELVLDYSMVRFA